MYSGVKLIVPNKFMICVLCVESVCIIFLFITYLVSGNMCVSYSPKCKRSFSCESIFSCFRKLWVAMFMLFIMQVAIFLHCIKSNSLNSTHFVTHFCHILPSLFFTHALSLTPNLIFEHSLHIYFKPEYIFSRQMRIVIDVYLQSQQIFSLSSALFDQVLHDVKDTHHHLFLTPYSSVLQQRS